MKVKKKKNTQKTIHKLRIVSENKVEKQIKPREDLNQIIFWSLFAGCGGSSLGYTLAGLFEVLAVEWDKHARTVFSLNFKNVPVKNLDISKTTGEELMKLANINVGRLDIFDASPPCQAFSLSNTNRNSGDERNGLYFKTLDLIESVQAKCFVIENVEGMRLGSMLRVWNQIVRKLDTMNYYVEYKVINAEEFGVPQRRRRVILIGLRKDIQEQFNITGLFPEPTQKNFEPLALKHIVPDVIGFSPGQFDDKFVSADRLMCTITKTSSAWFYERNGKRRKPTIAELKKLSSFPDSFKLEGGFTSQWARIGNSVPPNITRSIGLHIKNNILTPEVLSWCEEFGQFNEIGKMAA